MNAGLLLQHPRAAVGWGFCSILGILLLSLLVVPPATRDLPGFDFPRRLELPGSDGSARGTLVGDATDIVGVGGWHLPQTYRYHYLPAEGDMASDVDILATFYVSPRTDARKFPELYATSPWWSANEKDNTWVERSVQRSDSPERAWLEVDDWQGTYHVTRIQPDGVCTSTTEQVRKHEADARRARPWTSLSWPFSSRPEKDQRAVWVRMTVNKRIDGTPKTAHEIEELWRGVLSAMSGQARRSLR